MEKNAFDGTGLLNWLVARGDRWTVILCLGIFTFFALLVSGVFGPASVREGLTASDSVETLLQGLVGAILTGVTLVLSINQLVLSQELGSLGDQRKRMDGAMNFYRDVEDLLDEEVTSAQPSEFLQRLLEGIVERTERLRSELNRPGNTEEAGLEKLEELEQQAGRSMQKLSGTEFGTFDVVAATLSFNYSRYLHALRSVRYDVDVDDIISLLESFGTAREHVKTLYFQWEMIELSKGIVFTGMPAAILASASILYLNPYGFLLGQTFSMSHFFLATTLVVTLSLLPFFVMVSYVLRVATVAKNTLAIGPLVLE